MVLTSPILWGLSTATEVSPSQLHTMASPWNYNPATGYLASAALQDPCIFVFKSSTMSTMLAMLLSSAASSRCNQAPRLHTICRPWGHTLLGSCPWGAGNLFRLSFIPLNEFVSLQDEASHGWGPTLGIAFLLSQYNTGSFSTVMLSSLPLTVASSAPAWIPSCGDSPLPNSPSPSNLILLKFSQDGKMQPNSWQKTNKSQELSHPNSC